jgi:acetyl esterase/lipase
MPHSGPGRSIASQSEAEIKKSVGRLRKEPVDVFASLRCSVDRASPSATHKVSSNVAVRGVRIVREARTALHWLHQHLTRLGGDPARLYVSGWSAGGHLAAMLMGEALVAGGLAISGLFDLEPIRLSYLNEKLGLDAEQARRNSPLLNLPARATKLIIAYGSEELPELKRQSREFGSAWSARGLPGEMIEVADCHHYAVLEQLARPDGLLAKALAVSAATDRG